MTDEGCPPRVTAQIKTQVICMFTALLHFRAETQASCQNIWHKLIKQPPFYNVSWGNHHQRNGYLLWKPFVGHLSAIFIHLDTKNTRTTCMLMARGDKVTVHCNSETVTPAFENWQLKQSIKEKLKTTGWRKTEEVGQKFNCFLHMIHEDSRVRAARADHVVCTVWPQASVSAGALV